MGKILTLPQFKAYNQHQGSLLPLNLEELVPQGHLVRVVSTVIDSMDLRSVYATYKGGGTTSYHPAMLLKVIMYAYCMKIYTGRRIAQALRSDVYFMWLAGQNRPDFRTINQFRSERLKENIENLFEEMLLLLADHGYIKMESYFCDGSTFAADANRHKMVWRKNAERYQERARQECRRLFNEIDALNQAEDHELGNRDLLECGEEAQPITQETIAVKIESLNATMETAAVRKTVRKAGSLKRKLAEQQSKINKYQQQLDLGKGRSGYSVTDPDASAMHMKNEELLPAYNVLASSENQIITACTVHQNPNDSICFRHHLESIEQRDGLPKQMVADAGFGSAENYELLNEKEVEAFVKYPQFQAEQSLAHKRDRFHKDNFLYDPDSDSYTCPHNQKLTLKRTYQTSNRASDYKTTIKEYQCEDCSACPFYHACNKSPNTRNRLIKVNTNLEIYKREVQQRLCSENGLQLRRQRGCEIESCFGDIKHNMKFRRFHLRGLAKVKVEWTIVAMAHNFRKIALLEASKAA